MVMWELVPSMANTNDKTFDIKALILNKCDRVFLYRPEDYSDNFVIGVTGPERSTEITYYISYLNQYLATEY